MRGQHDIYYNSAGMDEVNADQASQLSEFSRIMMQIEEAARNTVGDWEGDGSQEFATESDEYQYHYDNVISAFREMINAGDETTEQFNHALTKIRSAY